MTRDHEDREEARRDENEAMRWSLRESEWPCGEDTTYLNCSVDAYKAALQAERKRGDERVKAERERCADICQEYAHSGIGVMRRQVAYACERRIRADQEGRA